MKATGSKVFFCLIQHLFEPAYLGQVIANIEVMPLAKTQRSPRLEGLFIEAFFALLALLALLARGYSVPAAGRGVLLTRNNWKFFLDTFTATLQVYRTQRIMSHTETQGHEGQNNPRPVVLCGFVALCELTLVPARGRPASVLVHRWFQPQRVSLRPASLIVDD